MGDYIDLEFFQNYTQTTYDLTTTPTSTFVETLISDAESNINEDTGRVWNSTVYTDELYDSPPRELLPINYPLVNVSEIRDKDGNVLDEGIDEDYTVDGNFVVFNKNKSVPDRIYMDYTAGYTNVPIKVKMLACLLTLSKIVQGGSAGSSNSSDIKVGPIAIKKQIGTQTVINLDADIRAQWAQVKRLIR